MGRVGESAPTKWAARWQIKKIGAAQVGYSGEPQRFGSDQGSCRGEPHWVGADQVGCSGADQNFLADPVSCRGAGHLVRPEELRCCVSNTHSPRYAHFAGVSC